MGPWVFSGSSTAYDGAADSASGEHREPCECRQEGTNDIR
jgi:hypothetical protein